MTNKILDLLNRHLNNRKKNLDNIYKILNHFDNPQDKLKIIHVAGTNGKGSTTAMIYSILHREFKNIGVYTSPHLVRVNERIKIDDVEISDIEFFNILKEVDEIANTHNILLGHFDILTVSAFIYFFRKKCKFVIMEVGLGGEFDATNVIKKPLVSVITNIGIDHEDVLGSDILDIARAKSGIIKKNCPTVLYDIKEGKSVFVERAKEKNSDLKIINENEIHINYKNEHFDYKEFIDIRTNLRGIHQIKNAVVSIEVIKTLRLYGIEIENNKIVEGLNSVKWPGRFDILIENENKILIVDGAHNPQCIDEVLKELAYVVNTKYSKEQINILFIISILRDKNAKLMFEMIYEFINKFNRENLKKITPNIILTKINYDRCYDLNSLCDIAKIYFKNISLCEDVKSAIETAKKINSEIIFITGSLYLVGEVIKIFNNMNFK